MRIQPLPHSHIHERHTHNLIHAPYLVEHRLGRVGIALLTRQQLHIAALEEKRAGFRKARCGDACKHIMVVEIEGNDFLGVMTKLMNGNIVSFIIHARRRDARAQERFLLASDSRPGMTTTAGRLHGYMATYLIGYSGLETQFAKHTRHVSLKGSRSGVALASDGCERIFGYGSTTLKTVVPDIIRTKVSAQSFANKRTYCFQFGR